MYKEGSVSSALTDGRIHISMNHGREGWNSNLKIKWNVPAKKIPKASKSVFKRIHSEWSFYIILEARSPTLKLATFQRCTTDPTGLKGWYQNTLVTFHVRTSNVLPLKTYSSLLRNCFPALIYYLFILVVPSFWIKSCPSNTLAALNNILKAPA